MGAGRHRWAERLLDLVVYAVGMTLAVAIVLLPPSLLVGGGLNGVKYGLFVAGVFAFGYATLLLWPSRPGEGEGGRTGQPGDPAGVGLSTGSGASGGDSEPRDDTRFESLVGRVPPLGRYAPRPVERFHPGTKLYVASLLMLAVSYAMEAVFGVST